MTTPSGPAPRKPPTDGASAAQRSGKVRAGRTEKKPTRLEKPARSEVAQPGLYPTEVHQPGLYPEASHSNDQFVAPHQGPWLADSTLYAVDIAHLDLSWLWNEQEARQLALKGMRN